METKRYHLDYDLSSGLGNPSVNLFLAGCDAPVKCTGCHNQEMLTINHNKVDLDKLMIEITDLLTKSQGFSKSNYLSFVGGDPLAPSNRDITREVSRSVGQLFPKVKQVVYTWRSAKDLNKLAEYVSHIDYAVLGPFKQDLKQEGMLPSTSNQIIFDLKKGEALPHIILRR